MLDPMPRKDRLFGLCSTLLLLSIGSCTGTIDNAAGPSSNCVQCGDKRDPFSQEVDLVTGVVTGEDGQPVGVGDPDSPDGVGYATRVPKLSNAQWERTVVDLLRLSGATGVSADFTQEPSDKGYDNLAAATLTVSADAWARYQTAAERMAETVTADATKLAKITPSGSFSNDAAKGEAFVSSFGQRAFRRPLSSEEKAAYVALFKRGVELVGGAAFPSGARLVIEAMLQSPHFLYRVESSVSDDPAQPKAKLSGYEVATRLSYGLWGTMPSDELLAAAAKGELDTADGVATWAGKLLDSPRAKEVLLSFHEQTFATRSYGTQDKDPRLGFDAAALASFLRDEAKLFFSEVLENDGGIAELLTAPVAFVNQSTAPFYGISGVTGNTLQRRELDPTARMGLFSQLGFLTKNATRTGSDPVHRGLTILRKVLCDEPDPPPMMFDLPTAEPGLTTRETYEKATACGGACHREMINPPGFAFEHFDAVGKVRTMEESKPIDAASTLVVRSGFSRQEKLDGPRTSLSFQNAPDLMQQLSTTPRVHECYARNLMTFLLAREPNGAERGANVLLGETSLNQSAIRALIIELVKLDTFRMRVSGAV